WLVSFPTRQYHTPNSLLVPCVSPFSITPVSYSGRCRKNTRPLASVLHHPVQDTTTNGEETMTAVLIMTETGTQFPIDPEGVENLVREYEVTRKRTNGAQVEFWLRSEYPC